MSQIIRCRSSVGLQNGQARQARVNVLLLSNTAATDQFLGPLGEKGLALCFTTDNIGRAACRPKQGVQYARDPPAASLPVLREAHAHQDPPPLALLRHHFPCLLPQQPPPALAPSAPST